MLLLCLFVVCWTRGNILRFLQRGRRVQACICKKQQIRTEGDWQTTEHSSQTSNAQAMLLLCLFGVCWTRGNNLRFLQRGLRVQGCICKKQQIPRTGTEAITKANRTHTNTANKLCPPLMDKRGQFTIFDYFSGA